MTGYLLLEGGMEFGGRMADPDQRAMALAGGADTPIRIIPTAAAPDHNHQRAGSNGVSWFRSLGATNVASLPLIDRVSANDATIADELRSARLIYLLGGFPHYLGETLAGSMCWQAVQTAYEHGAIIAGSSAGAMVLCSFYYNPQNGEIATGLGLVPNACVLPHYNTFGQRWVTQLTQLLPQVTLLGIDERTGMLDDGPASDGQRWWVYGQGCVTLHRAGQTTVYAAGDTFGGV